MTFGYIQCTCVEHVSFLKLFFVSNCFMFIIMNSYGKLHTFGCNGHLLDRCLCFVIMNFFVAKVPIGNGDLLHGNLQ